MHSTGFFQISAGGKYLFDYEDIILYELLAAFDLKKINHQFLLGTIVHRNEIVPVIDLGMRLNGKALDSKNAFVILSLVDQQVVGFVVDTIDTFLEISDDETFGGMPLKIFGVCPAVLADYWKSEEGNVFILDPSYLIFHDELAFLEESLNSIDAQSKEVPNDSGSLPLDPGIGAQ